MAQNSKIEWTHHTANLWHGCTKVNAGCDNCYAEAMARRWGRDIWGNDKPRLVIQSVWTALTKMQADAKQAGEIHRVFVGSMMDIFEKPMPLIFHNGEKGTEYMHTGQLRDKLWRYIDRGYFPNLLFLLLTKRPGNINKYIPESWKANPPANVMFGTSVVNQATADTLIPQLLQVNGKRFLSIEPQLEQVDIWQYLNRTVYLPGNDGRIDWVIQGGESGHHRRPFDLAWAYAMFWKCKLVGTPYFFKQIDKVQPIPDDLMVRQFPA